MGFIGKAVKSGIAIKLANAVVRAARKPENQRKAKEMLATVRHRRNPGPAPR